MAQIQIPQQQVNIQPLQGPGVGIQPSVAGSFGLAAGTLNQIGNDLQELKDVNAAQSLLTQESLAFNAELGAIRAEQIPPDQKVAKVKALAGKYMHADKEKTKGFSSKALAMYSTGMRSQILTHSAPVMNELVMADITYQRESWATNFQTHVRDVAAYQEGSLQFQQGLKDLRMQIDLAPVSLIPDKEKMYDQAIQQIGVAQFEKKARQAPLALLYDVKHDKVWSFTVEGPNGKTITIDPKEKERIIGIAHNQISFENEQEKFEQQQNEYRTTRAADELVRKIRIDLYQERLGALDEALADPSSETYRILSTSNKLEELVAFREKMHTSRAQKDPLILGDVSKIKEKLWLGHDVPEDEIWRKADWTHEQRKEMQAFRQQQLEKRRDHDYKRYEQKLRAGVDAVVGWTKGKNPINAALGGIDSEMEQTKFRFLVRMQKKESDMLSKKGHYEELDPSLDASLFIKELSQNVPDNFQQDADKMMRTLAQFSEGKEPTHERLMYNIRYSGLPEAEKQLLMGLLSQSLKQGDVTIERIISMYKGEISTVADRTEQDAIYARIKALAGSYLDSRIKYDSARD